MKRTKKINANKFFLIENNFPLTASLPVTMSLYSVGGAAALCSCCSTTARSFITTIVLIAATLVRSPSAFCHGLLAPHSATLQSAILLHSSHHVIGLPSALFAKLIDAIKVWSGDVIQFNSVLMACLKALFMCDNFTGVCHRLGEWRDNAVLDYVSK